MSAICWLALTMTGAPPGSEDESSSGPALKT
jgi:hypothetical protein